MPEPFFSVILPTYNRARMAAAAAFSVLAQSEGDWELLIVNDGSSDDTMQLIERLPEDPRIRMSHMTRNQGQHKCRNFAIREARGKFITFLDDDDLYLPDRLAKFKAAAQAQPDVGFWFSNAVQRRGDLIFSHLFDPQRKIPEGTVPGYYAVGDEFLPYVTTNIAVDKKAFTTFGLYREDLKILEDTELYARMLGGGLKVGVIPEALSVRTLHQGQITGDYQKDYEEALIALKAGNPPQDVFERKKRALAVEVAGYLLKNLEPAKARALLREALGDEAAAQSVYKLALIPRPLLAMAKCARQGWLRLRYSSPLAPREFTQAAEQIRPYLEQAAKL